MINQYDERPRFTGRIRVGKKFTAEGEIEASLERWTWVRLRIQFISADCILGWLVGCIEDLVALAVFQPYRDLKASDNQSLKFKWRGGESNPGPLAPQAKSVTTRPLPTA